MTGKGSQKKGVRGETELRDILRNYGFDVQRGASQNYGTIPDLYGLPGVHIECKYVEKLNIHKAMQQAKRDADRFQDGFPCVFHRKNRTGWLCTMTLDAWVELYNISQKRGDR